MDQDIWQKYIESAHRFANLTEEQKEALEPDVKLEMKKQSLAVMLFSYFCEVAEFFSDQGKISMSELADITVDWVDIHIGET